MGTSMRVLRDEENRSGITLDLQATAVAQLTGDVMEPHLAATEGKDRKARIDIMLTAATVAAK